MFGARFVCLSLFLLFLSTGCSHHGSQYSFFNMVSPEKRTLENRAAAEKFWNSIRPVSTLPTSHYKLGQYYLHQKKYNKAIDEFSKAIWNDPSFCKAYNGLGISYDALKECEKAEETYEKALVCDPEEAYLYNNYAYSSLLCGNHVKGLALLRKAENLSEGNARIRIDHNIKLAQAMIDREVREAYKKPPETDIQLTDNQPEVQQERGAGTIFPSQNRKKLFLQDSFGSEQVIVKFFAGRTKNIIIEDGMEIPPRFLNSVIELLNGNGMKGMAAKSASYLNGHGFQIQNIANASHFEFKESVIYYRPGYLQIAKDIAGVIPGAQEIQRIEFLGLSSTGVRVILGQDLVNMRFPEGYDVQNISCSSVLKKSHLKPAIAANDGKEAAMKQGSGFFPPPGWISTQPDSMRPFLIQLSNS